MTDACAGWTFNGRHNFANARWARGNCWITVSIPDFIELLNLQPGDGLREFLVSTLKAQIDALVKYQDPKTGLWHTLIDDPNSYVESSATAGFAYGILKAVRTRLLPNDPVYINSAKKAIAGVINCITVKGELEQCSFGTPVFKDLDGYRKIPITS
jgi:unsaturated rhamnogalacturonyl hydrolase